MIDTTKLYDYTSRSIESVKRLQEALDREKEFSAKASMNCLIQSILYALSALRALCLVVGKEGETS